MTKIRAKANRNIVDVPEPRAGKLVRAGIFEYVEDPEPAKAPAPPPAPAEVVEEVEAEAGEERGLAAIDVHIGTVVAGRLETEGDDLSLKTRRELEELAEGLDVAGTGTNGYVTKADLVRALRVRYGRRDLRAED